MNTKITVITVHYFNCKITILILMAVLNDSQTLNPKPLFWWKNNWALV